MRARRKKWVQKALGVKRRRVGRRRRVVARRKGALHRQLGIPAGEKIPLARLRRAAKAPGLLGKRARLALTMRKFHHKRG
jgi:hypothetical protein